MPKLQRTSAMLIPLAGVLAVTGCLDVQQDVWVNPDGTGRLRLDMGLVDSVSEPLEGDQIPPAERMLEELKRVQRRIHDDPRIRQIHVEQYARDGYNRAAMDILVDNWEELPAITDLILSEERGATADLSAFLRFSFREESDGMTYYRQPPGSEPIPPSSAIRGMGPPQPEVEPGSAMEQALARDVTLTVTLHSPTVSRTNGTWQMDKSSVRWVVHLTDLMSEGSGPGFFADIGPSARSSHFWRIVGILLTVTLLVLLLAWFRSGRGEREETPTAA